MMKHDLRCTLCSSVSSVVNPSARRRSAFGQAETRFLGANGTFLTDVRLMFCWLTRLAQVARNSNITASKLTPNVGLASLLLVNAVFAQEPVQKSLNAPFVQQPKLTGIEVGTVGLFADWTPNKQGTHELIVINRTTKPVTLSYAYENPDCVLEAKNDDGVWERATVHIDHLCGTGIGSYQLKPDFFSAGIFGIPNDGSARKMQLEKSIEANEACLSHANMTREAREAKLVATKQLQSELAELEKHLQEREIRICIYGENVKATSNSTTAVIDVRVIAAAKCDRVGIQTASLERLESIIMGEEVIESESSGGVPFDPVNIAIDSLGAEEHSIEKAAAILRRVIAESKDENLVVIAKEKLAAKPFK